MPVQPSQLPNGALRALGGREPGRLGDGHERPGPVVDRRGERAAEYVHATCCARSRHARGGRPAGVRRRVGMPSGRRLASPPGRSGTAEVASGPRCGRPAHSPGRSSLGRPRLRSRRTEHRLLSGAGIHRRADRMPWPRCTRPACIARRTLRPARRLPASTGRAPPRRRYPNRVWRDRATSRRRLTAAEGSVVRRCRVARTRRCALGHGQALPRHSAAGWPAHSRAVAPRAAETLARCGGAMRRWIVGSLGGVRVCGVPTCRCARCPAGGALLASCRPAGRATRASPTPKSRRGCADDASTSRRSSSATAR